MIERHTARPKNSTARFFVILVVLLLATGLGAFHVIARNRGIFIGSLSARVDMAQLFSTTQDEVLSARGYAMTGQAVFLRRYNQERAQYPGLMKRLRRDLIAIGQLDASHDVERYDATHRRWERQIGSAMIRRDPVAKSSAFVKRGSAMLDRMRDLATTVDRTLRRRSDWIAKVANLAIGSWVFVIVALTIGFGILAVNGERRRRALEAELRADIAERNAALERSNEALQEFAYVASHDLQEPLRTVVSFTELLQRRYAGRLDAQADEFIGFALDGAKRMQRLINDVLQYSRVTTHGGLFGRVDLQHALDAALLGLLGLMEERGAEVIVTPPMPTVVGDTAQLTQLFSNLIGNAIKYNLSERPRVNVDARREGDAWLVRVRDNGIGIAAESYERIFGIFTRLHTREEFEGTGIGLALCRRIVERHNGRIWLESSEGSGTSFFFTLPAEGA